MIGYNNYRYVLYLCGVYIYMWCLGNYVMGIWNIIEIQGYVIINFFYFVFLIINDLIKEVNLFCDLFINFIVIYWLFFC